LRKHPSHQDVIYAKERRKNNEPWKVLEYCASPGEIYDIVIEDMDRQARGLTG
jgi:hypothetical protein